MPSLVHQFDDDLQSTELKMHCRETSKRNSKLRKLDMKSDLSRGDMKK